MANRIACWLVSTLASSSQSGGEYRLFDHVSEEKGRLMGETGMQNQAVCPSGMTDGRARSPGTPEPCVEMGVTVSHILLS